MYLFFFLFNTLYGCAGEVSAEAASETLAYPFTDAKIVVLWETAKKDGQKKMAAGAFSLIKVKRKRPCPNS